MSGAIRSGVGAGAADFREDSVHEFGQYGAESQGEKLREEICAADPLNRAARLPSDLIHTNVHRHESWSETERRSMI